MPSSPMSNKFWRRPSSQLTSSCWIISAPISCRGYVKRARAIKPYTDAFFSTPDDIAMLAHPTIDHYQAEFVGNDGTAGRFQRRAHPGNVPDLAMHSPAVEFNRSVPEHIVSWRCASVGHRSSLDQKPQGRLNRMARTTDWLITAW